MKPARGPKKNASAEDDMDAAEVEQLRLGGGEIGKGANRAGGGGNDRPGLTVTAMPRKLMRSSGAGRWLLVPVHGRSVDQDTLRSC